MHDSDACLTQPIWIVPPLWLWHATIHQTLALMQYSIHNQILFWVVHQLRRHSRVHSREAPSQVKEAWIDGMYPRHHLSKGTCEDDYHLALESIVAVSPILCLALPSTPVPHQSLRSRLWPVRLRTRDARVGDGAPPSSRRWAQRLQAAARSTFCSCTRSRYSLVHFRPLSWSNTCVSMKMHFCGSSIRAAFNSFSRMYMVSWSGAP